ncbi:MAG: 50S ribosomal protein L11 methyltransferase [Bacteroidetes bacterium]|nr:50S ribosomal protein L11 methyltransferase [Bacteroidota bacterium]
MKNYNEFTVTSIPFNTDLLSGLLWELPIIGINELDNFLLVFTEESNPLTESEISECLSGLIKNNLAESITVSKRVVESQNWNEEWEKNLRVIEVTDRIVIKPSFKEYMAKDNQIILHIDPKMSFGTGEHETTRLVLELLDSDYNGEAKVLDLGSGTGVLGICAAKLGAGKVFLVDNDEWCFENGKENIAANNVGECTSITLGEISDLKEDQFDLIIANINRHILLSIGSDIKTKLKRSGKLILSGLLVVDIEDITESYRNIGFKIIKQKSHQEWAALVLELEN